MLRRFMRDYAVRARLRRVVSELEDYPIQSVFDWSLRFEAEQSAPEGILAAFEASLDRRLEVLEQFMV